MTKHDRAYIGRETAVLKRVSPKFQRGRGNLARPRLRVNSCRTGHTVASSNHADPQIAVDTALSRTTLN
ncbi:MAG: hypothetical protein MI923_23805 [Phycisphaerales bacterium]|nr:hypothetical protein [Phycisphaerales bacterium]